MTATCALELGIDVGSLDATLHMGFPGSLSSLWQQAGRAGRGGRRSLAIIVCFDSPLDQLFCRSPSSLLDRPAETAVVPDDNVIVLRGQLLCAAKEAPLRFTTFHHHSKASDTSDMRAVATVAHDNAAHLTNIRKGVRGHNVDKFSSEEKAAGYGEVTDYDDSILFGYDGSVETIDYLLQEGTMTATTTTNQSKRAGVAEGRWTTVRTETVCHCHPSIESPSRERASLRMIDPVTITVVDATQSEGPGDEGLGGRAIDSIGYSRAFYELFEGAIYLHQARQYLVTHLDIPGVSNVEAGTPHSSRPRALVRPVRVNYYTSARNHTNVDVTKRLESGLGAAKVLSTGCVTVVSRVWGWRKHWAGSGNIAEMGQFSLPPLEYSTRAVWIDVPPEVRREVEAFSRHGSTHSELPNSGADSPEDEPLIPAESTEVMLYDEHEAGCSGCSTFNSIKEEDFQSEEAAAMDYFPSKSSESKSAVAQTGRQSKRAMAMSDRFLAALHGLNHVIVAVAPLFVLCEQDDIATEHVYPFQMRPRPPRLIIFDKRPGGIGVAEALFRHMPEVLRKAHEVISTCPCTNGCPACVYDGKCTNHNAVIDKAGAALLALRLGDLVGVDGNCSGSKSTNDLIDASPRRAQRLQMARAMDCARTRGSAVRDPWTNAMVPDFQSMFD